MAYRRIEAALTDGNGHEIFVDAALRERALLPLDRMLGFAKSNSVAVKGNA